MKTQEIPKGYHSLTTYLTVRGAAKAFDAKELAQLTMPDESIGHAEIEIGDSKIMLAEENEKWDNLSPQTLGDSPVSLCLYVEDVDAVFFGAIRAGAKVTGKMEVKDQFYGDRTGNLTDPFGHQWSVMTRIEDVSFEEMQKRMNALFS